MAQYIKATGKEQGRAVAPKKTPDTLRLNLRLSKSLHKRLLNATKGDSPELSLQQEIVRRLENSFDDRPSPATMAAIEEAAKISTIGGVVEVLSDPDIVAHLVAKYPRFRAALVAALATDEERIIP